MKTDHIRKGKAGCPPTPASCLGETTVVISVYFVFNLHKAFISDSPPTYSIVIVLLCRYNVEVELVCLYPAFGVF